MARSKPLLDWREQARRLEAARNRRRARWDHERDTWANNIWIDKSEADAFKAAWCRYRDELESATLADLSPAHGASANGEKKDG